MTSTRPAPSAEEVWRKYDAMEARLTAGLSERMLDLAGIQSGMRVLDLATGRGEPAIRAAHRVGTDCMVLGLDLSPGMLQMARERATLEGITNLELRAMNVESPHGIPSANFHAVVMRWGLMYLNSPVAALSAARRAMRPDAKFVAAVWAEPEHVQYFSLPRRVLAQFTPLPPVDPQSPGTFHYADLNRLQEDLASAGFRIDHVEDMVVDVMEATSGTDLIAWARTFVVSRVLDSLPEYIQQAWEAAMRIDGERLRRNGLIRLNGTTRIVVASSLS